MIPSYGRLAGAVVAVMIGLVVLWQAGILFTSEDAGEVNLAPADTSLTTPPVEGFVVGLKPGNLAPDFEFSDVGGDRVRLSQFRGRPVLVNFWATWCLPCRAEMPDIQAAQHRYEDDKVAVLAINQEESYTAIKDWVDELNLDLTAVGYDPEGSIYDLFYGGGLEGLPVSYFIDGKGVITHVVLGPITEAALDSALQQAIAGYEAAQD